MDFIRDLNTFIRMNKNLFDQHFYKNYKTSRNPYYKIDALIWSATFYEKVDRYSREVLVVAEYFLKHHEYFSQLSLEDIKNGAYNWNVYRTDYNFKQKIFEINPPLS